MLHELEFHVCGENMPTMPPVLASFGDLGNMAGFDGRKALLVAVEYHQ